MIYAMLQKVAGAMGLNVNGLLAGIALALFFMWSNQKPRPRVGEPQGGQQPGAAASGAAEGTAASGDAPGADIDEVASGAARIVRGLGLVTACADRRVLPCCCWL